MFKTFIFSFTTTFLLFFGFFPVSAYAVSVDIVDLPDTISEEAFEIKINISSNSKAGTINYLRSSFYVVGTDDYFGYTKNNVGIWYKDRDYSQYFALKLDENGSASAKLEVKIDTGSKYFKGAGKYGFKIRRYTQSGKSYTWSNEFILDINVKKPEAVVSAVNNNSSKAIVNSSVANLNSLVVEDSAASLSGDLISTSYQAVLASSPAVLGEAYTSSRPDILSFSSQAAMQDQVSNSAQEINLSTKSAVAIKKVASSNSKYKVLTIGGVLLVALSALMFIIKLLIFKKTFNG